MPDLRSNHVLPPRTELPGALYHVTSRGDRREDIYLKDGDPAAWIDILAAVCKRFNWAWHAWCQMTNHYHVVIETPEGNLSQGMRQLNRARAALCPRMPAPWATSAGIGLGR